MFLILMQTLILKAIFIFGITLFGFFASWYHYQEEYLFQYFEDDALANDYDYIVVGAGSAGAIVALRLAQQNGGSGSVLLLEAGSYGGPVLNIPLSSQLIQLTDVDWQYKTTPQASACKAFDNNQCLWPRGKLVGGSSRLNNMIHFEGHPTDFPPWFSSSNYTANYTNDIKPYFKRVQTYLIDQYHIPYLTELSEALLEAGREILGIPIRDYKKGGEFSTGFMVPTNNIKNGKRYLSGEYLIENKISNLKISTHSHVEKIIFKEGGVLLDANGIVFKRFGEIRKVFANKAVVLSAGAVSSPHILMLSGLGPSFHLASHFITPLLDLPQVGQNLQDHVTTGFDLFHLEHPLESITPATLISPWTFLRYNFFGEGPWTFGQCDAMAILYLDCLMQHFAGDKNKIRKSNETYEECEKRQTGPPDLQLALVPMGFNSDMGIFLRKMIGLGDNTWENYVAHYLHRPTFFILPIVLHPKSVGFISLASSSPEVAPIINPNYLTHPYDVQTLIRGIKVVLELVQRGTIFKDKLGAKLNTIKVPGCVEWEFGSWDYWECYVREVTLSVYHPIGTCRMGENSKTSVVDNEFLVHGTKNVYIVDASIMPTLPSGNINAAIVMLAEKATDVIIKKYSEVEKLIKSDKKLMKQSEEKINENDNNLNEVNVVEDTQLYKEEQSSGVDKNIVPKDEF